MKITQYKTGPRKRVNFMMSIEVLEQMEILVPVGKRSDFVNEAMGRALIQFGRQKAFDEGSALREKLNLKIGSDEELLKKIRYGRKEW
jgi:3-methyladenine DNA glycosylase AlkD